jgi:phosphatidylglycerophosphatase A
MTEHAKPQRSAIAHLIGTVGYVGHLKPAPGTWGSVAAFPIAFVLQLVGGFPLLALATVVAFFKGWWATERMTQGQDDHDPSEVVIDEVVGQWIALWPVSLGAWMRDIDVFAMWPGLLSAFILFRLFDIWKPGPVGWADARSDSLGVMLDDVIAGLFAALGTIALAAVAHGLLMS